MKLLKNTNSKLLWTTVILFAVGGIYLGYISITTFQEAEINIEWETASEVDTVGFNILRGETLQGDFTQINDQLIPASTDPLSVNAYSYTDTNVKAGEIYYYFLEDMETSGITNRHGPLEVKAASPKWLEVSLAAVIILGAILGGIQYIQAPRGKASDTL